MLPVQRGLAVARLGESRWGAGRSTSPCSGMVTAARISASTATAPRQPTPSTRPAVNGEKTKLEQAAMRVRAVKAELRRTRNHLVTTTNADSYSTRAMASPRPRKTRYICGSVETRDQASTSAVAMTEPAVISSRGLVRSSNLPTGMMASPELSNASE